MANKYLVINKTTDKILMIADDEDSAYTFIKLSHLNFDDCSIEKVEMKYFGRSIIISIRSEWVWKILNGEKTLEIRKLFPKDYIGWVYIYCTKGKPYLKQCEHFRVLNYTEISNKGYYLNGKVVARFWCDKVEEIALAKLENGVGYDYIYDTDTLLAQDFYKKSCLENWDLLNYFGHKYKNGEVVGYAIHITRLETFDKPMELTMFRKVGYKKAQMENGKNKERQSFFGLLREWSLTKAPQSWQYIED